MLISFNSCAPRITTVTPPVKNPEKFSYTGTEAIPEKWWKVFEDEQLNKLIDSALGNNLDLATTWAQFQEATAIKRAQSTFLLPDIEAEARAAVSRPKPDFAGGENMQLGLSAAYEIDLWGRIRASVQAEEFRMQASYYDYQAAAMSLSAEIANTWYRLLTTQQQLKLAREQIETNKDIIKLIRVRFGSGQIRAVDILRQTQLLESTKDLKIIYETNLELLKNELAVLLAIPPQNFERAITDSLPELPEIPATGLPLELVRRRPDVKQAFNLVLAADRDMAVAIRNKFPRISLALSAQVRSNSYNNLFQEWAYTLAGNIVAPLLYWGRLRAEVDRTEAIKNQQLYQYGQTVLIAFREVEDALLREQKQTERIKVLENRLDLAKKTNRQLRIEFVNGLSEYLDVLLALDQEQQLRRDMLEAKQQQLEIRIELYRALAGSFETNRETTSNL